MLLAYFLIFFSLSLFIWLFVSFSYFKQYRYYTLLTDLLPFYSPLVIIGYVFYFTSVFFLSVSFSYWLFFLLLVPVPFIIVILYLIHRWRSCYSLSRYESFLQLLISGPFSVKLFSDYHSNSLSSDKVNVFIRHDVDLSIKRLKRILELEKKYNFRSTCFFRLHSPKYSLDSVKPFIRSLVQDGFEIGFHYESLSQTKGNKSQAILLFSEELNLLRSLADISVVSHHGDRFNNHLLYPLLDHERLGIWSAYDMRYDLYLTDTGGNDMYRSYGHHIFERLHDAKPGDVVQILIHADWWY